MTFTFVALAIATGMFLDRIAGTGLNILASYVLLKRQRKADAEYTNQLNTLLSNLKTGVGSDEDPGVLPKRLVN